MKRFLLWFYFGIGIIPLSSANPIRMISTNGWIKQYPHADYITVFDSTKVTMMESGLSYYNEHQMVMILTPEAGKYFNVYKSDYDPLTASVEISKVIVYYKNGLKRN